MIGAHQARRAARRRIFILLRWGAGLAVLLLLAHVIPREPLRAALARVPGTRFLAILLAYLLVHLVGIAKWRMTVNAAGAGLDFSTSAQCYCGGLFGVLFLPSILGGDVVRLAVGLRRSPQPAGVLAGNIADRILDVCAQGGLVLVGLFLLPESLPGAWQAAARRALLIAALLGMVVALLSILLYRPLLRGRSVRFRRRLARFRHALRSVWRRPHVLVLGWLMGLFIQASFVLLGALLAMSCGLLLPLRVWLFAWPLAKVVALLPLTQGGIGVREAALVVLLAPFGVAGPLAFATGLVWEAVVICGGLLAGLAALLLRRLDEPEEQV